MLKYLPFAASGRMVAAARNNPALSLGARGSAVAFLQAGLIQQKIPLPKSTKKGVPDGDYGMETYEAVKTFQRANKIAPADGVAGHDTITTLDALLASAAAPIPPAPPGPV